MDTKTFQEHVRLQPILAEIYRENKSNNKLVKNRSKLNARKIVVSLIKT
jgi:hypothetical protein